MLSCVAADEFIATIDAKDRNIDYARYGFYDTTTGEPPAPLGIEGARKVAQAIEADFKLLGRPVQVEEHVAPKTYLSVLSDKGGVQMFDAESGQQLWSTSIGDGSLPLVGPAMSNEMVALLYGAEVFVLDKLTGKVVHQMKLASSVSAMPVAVGNSLFVPEVNGVVATYDIETLEDTQASLRFTDAVRITPIASADGSFVAWPIGKYLYTAKFDRKLELWSRLEALSEITCTPTVLSDGFVVVTADGTILRLNFDRYNSIVWRENVGVALYSRPITNGDVIVVNSAGGRVFCLDAKSGSILWSVTVPGASSALTITKTSVYFQDLSGGLVSVALNDGHVQGRLVKALAQGVRNDYSDRVYLRSRDGRLMSLHEVNQVKPTFHPSVEVMRGAAPPKADTPKVEETVAPPETTEEEAAPESDNPFGGGDSPFGGASEDSNPFGGGGEEPNPFGS